jgi:hypothetical protein
MSNNILKISFDASTINGIISKDIKYYPSMSNPQLYSSFPNILFIPSVKLTASLFDKGLGEEDKKKIFLSPAQFDNFLIRLKEKKLYKPITINEAKTRGIIYNNINFILNLFFKKGDKLVINTKPYIINNYNWNDKYNIIPIPGQKTPIIELKISFVLHGGKELSFVDSTKLNCMQKKQEIVNDYYSLVGLKKPVEKTASLEHQPVDTTTKPIPMSPPSRRTRRTRSATLGGRKHKTKKV